MTAVHFLVSAVHAYAAAMARYPDLPEPWPPAPAIVGLSAGDLAELQARVDALPPAWCMKRHESCDGEVSAMVMPEADDDGAMPTFVICREAGRVCVDVCRDDSYARLGSYGTLARAVQGVVKALARARPGH